LERLGTETKGRGSQEKEEKKMKSGQNDHSGLRRKKKKQYINLNNIYVIDKV